MQTNNKELFNSKLCQCYKCEDGDGTGEILPKRGLGESRPQQEDSLDLSWKDLTEHTHPTLSLSGSWGSCGAEVVSLH